MEQSKVDLVNRCLLSIGEAPIEDTTVLDTIPLGTDVDIAKRMVEDTIRDVLVIGWYFNMDYDYELVPDTNGFITVPPNVIRIDFGETEFRRQLVLRNGKIYNVIDNTYVIGQPVVADLFYLVAVEELPIPAYEYIANRAARKFQERVIGSSDLSRITKSDELDALVSLQRIQMQTQDYSLIRGSRIHNGYLIAGLYKSRGRR